jgi:hypothetical protein
MWTIPFITAKNRENPLKSVGWKWGDVRRAFQARPWLNWGALHDWAIEEQRKKIVEREGDMAHG